MSRTPAFSEEITAVSDVSEVLAEQERVERRKAHYIRRDQLPKRAQT